MTTHQQKKLDNEALLSFRDHFQLPLSDDQVTSLSFYKPADDSPEMQYLHERRKTLGGYMPSRVTTSDSVTVPPLSKYAKFALEANSREMSTTMAFVRMLGALLKDKKLGPRVVPIVADEARTFGMANLFKQVGIYSSVGQRYDPEDIGSILSYREAKDGQILEEGISEAGAISSWAAAATSYAVHGLSMMPFYIYYSMFGFQRIGDHIWAAADQRARGFLIGATAGKTTLGGEGLQHQDGHSHLIASTITNCRAYDPAFAGELAVIVDYGMRQMLEQHEDIFYYLTTMNENYGQPSLKEGVEQDIIKGMYHYETSSVQNPKAKVRLLGSGTIMLEVIESARLLAEDWGIESEIWSVTSYTELGREARNIERWNLLNPEEIPRVSHVERCLEGDVSVIAATDYVRAVPQLATAYLRARCTVLGTDGFGRSDTRSVLREFFEVNRNHITIAALSTLAREGKIDSAICAKAIEKYGIDSSRSASWEL